MILPLNRSSFGYSEPVDESRFLRDIPEELISYSGQTRRFSKVSRSEAIRWQRMDSASSSRVEHQYKAGAAVVHSTWGDGLVLNSRIENDDEIIDVFFAGVGLKRLAASHAKLELKS